MPAPSTTNDFLDLIRKSGVADDSRLKPHVEKLRAEGRLPKKPTQLAGLLVQSGLLTNFQAQQLLQGKWRRFTIGKYKVLERLGSGGMGSVYLCEHKLMRRRVAVKVLPTARAAEESSLERFYREARAVAALDHENIVHAYDIDQDDTLHFLVMEYVDGASFQEIVKKSGPLESDRAANYIWQTTQGLAHAHAAGLIHRDIKPGNLLVDRTGVVKILDMGLARFFNDEEDMLTRKFDENVLGTADYLAPEQALDSHEVDVRADIYSLGATFYFLLTAKTPFEEGTIAQKLIWHQTRQPKAIQTIRNDVPAELIAVVNRMMAKDAEDRYQHPLEVAEALQGWADLPPMPPLESEVPHLSPAVSGGAKTDSLLAGATNKAGPGSSRKNWQVSTPAPASGGAPAPNPAVAQPKKQSPNERAATAQRPTPLPAQPPRHLRAPAPAANQVETSPWENLFDEDVPSTDNEDTISSTASTPRPHRPILPRGKWTIVALVATLALIGVMVIAILVIIINRNNRARRSGQPAPARKPLKVSRNLSITGAHRSIQAALRRARNGDVIELWDSFHEENVRVDPRLGTTEVTIRAAPKKIVVWTYPQDREKTPLLRLNNARNFKLIGNRITLDGRSEIPTLIEIESASTGLTVKNLHLGGFTEQAIRITNCRGSKGRPVLFERLQFTPAEEAQKAFAYFFDPKKPTGARGNQYFKIKNCTYHDMTQNVIKGKAEVKNLVIED